MSRITIASFAVIVFCGLGNLVIAFCRFVLRMPYPFETAIWPSLVFIGCALAVWLTAYRLSALSLQDRGGK